MSIAGGGDDSSVYQIVHEASCPLIGPREPSPGLGAAMVMASVSTSIGFLLAYLCIVAVKALVS